MKQLRKVILDCDPGIDDALALLLAVASPEIHLMAVTCVAGNRPVDITSANARKLLDLAQHYQVPVYAGAARPLAHPSPRCNEVHGLDGLGGVTLSQATEIEPGYAADIIVRILQEEPAGSVTLIGIGPLTNFALAEIRKPDILRRARALLIMGGAAFCPGNITPAAEFNFYADALAAHIVMNAQARSTIFGLDVTSKVVMSADWIAAVGNLPTRSGKALGRMLATYASLDPLLHDACPVAYLLDQDLFGGIECALAVGWREGPDEGKSVAWAGEQPDRPFSPNAMVMTEVRAAKLLDLVLSRLANLP
jgi:purine nucleosidase